MTVIDHRYFPHLIDMIWDHMDARSCVMARMTCKEWKRRAIPKMMRHIVLEKDSRSGVSGQALRLKSRVLADPNVTVALKTVAAGARSHRGRKRVKPARNMERDSKWLFQDSEGLDGRFWREALKSVRVLDLGRGFHKDSTAHLLLLMNARNPGCSVWKWRYPHITLRASWWSASHSAYDSSLHVAGSVSEWVLFLPLVSRALPSVSITPGPIAEHASNTTEGSARVYADTSRKLSHIVLHIECYSNPLKPLSRPFVIDLSSRVPKSIHGVMYTVILSRPPPGSEEPALTRTARSETPSAPNNSGDGRYPRTDGYKDALVQSQLSLSKKAWKWNDAAVHEFADPEALVGSLFGYRKSRLEIVGLEQFLPPELTAERYVASLISREDDPSRFLGLKRKVSVLSLEKYREKVGEDTFRIHTVK